MQPKSYLQNQNGNQLLTFLPSTAALFYTIAIVPVCSMKVNG
ncbi:hypothetical protein [Ligilactobacillus aviarius]|nr:hypothetical protein [Ligilactobacillus aviarius]